MASFVYNRYRSDKVFDLAESQKQWYGYLQKKEFHDDLTKSLKAEGESYRKELHRNAELASKDMNALRQEFSQASEQQLEAIHEQTQSITESANMICGTLAEGFSKVSGKLDNICATLDWRLTAVEDQLRISNMLLGNIALLLRVPDFQKERQYYIEQGFKHYKNATLDSDIYEDALKNLLEAEKRETTDYVVLHRIGMIYLYANKEEILSLSKAEEYFRRAAKYAIVESNPDTQQTLNLLSGDSSKELSAQATTPEAAKAVAARAYFQAGVACYAQGKFAEAVELSEKAYSLLPSFLEAGFLQAKSIALLGNGEKSAEILQGIIETERFYAAKTASDADFAIKKEVKSMLQQLRDDAIEKASNKLTKIKQEILSDSQAKPFLPEIENLVSKQTYLDSLKALDEIARKRFWIRPILKFENKCPNKIEYNEVANSIEDFVIIESEDKKSVSEWQQQIIKAKSNIEKLNGLQISINNEILKLKSMIISNEYSVPHLVFPLVHASEYPLIYLQNGENLLKLAEKYFQLYESIFQKFPQESLISDKCLELPIINNIEKLTFSVFYARAFSFHAKAIKEEHRIKNKWFPSFEYLVALYTQADHHFNMAYEYGKKSIQSAPSHFLIELSDSNIYPLRQDLETNRRMLANVKNGYLNVSRDE